MDSDFHGIDPKNRSGKAASGAKVIIGRNVFIGEGVTILKGVTIGDNAVVGSRAVVTKSVPANTIAAGNPACVVKKIESV
jgi:maltose O-acetyltransferase